MADSAPPASDLDLFDDEVLVDPYPSFAALRDLGPVVRLPANDVYALARDGVIREALRDWETFSSAGAIGFNPAVNEALTGTSLASDPPAHTRLRATLTANLSPRGAASARRARDCLCAGLLETDSVYSPFASVAEEVGYTADPALEPSPFFTSMHGYRTHATRNP